MALTKEELAKQLQIYLNKNYIGKKNEKKSFWRDFLGGGMLRKEAKSVSYRELSEKGQDGVLDSDEEKTASLMASKKAESEKTIRYGSKNAEFMEVTSMEDEPMDDASMEVAPMMELAREQPMPMAEIPKEQSVSARGIPKEQSMPMTGVPREQSMPMMEQPMLRMGNLEEFGAKDKKDITGSKKNNIGDFLADSYEEGAVAKRLNLYMYERDITTAMIYERCFVDRKLISKITSNSNYHPSKSTMLALCIGLQLNLEEGEGFLSLAGYSFSNASKFDLIIKFMLTEQVYDLDTVNDMLDRYNQPCLGA